MQEQHVKLGHSSWSRTWNFLKKLFRFQDAAKTKRMLEDESQRCAVCSKAKVNRPSDRGVEVSLPMPFSFNTEVAIELGSGKDGVNNLFIMETLKRYCQVAVVLAELNSLNKQRTRFGGVG